MRTVNPLCTSMASFIAAIDTNSSDVAEYLDRRLEPVFEAVGEIAQEAFAEWEHVDDDASGTDPDFIQAQAYESGVKAAVKLLRVALGKVAAEARTLEEMRNQEAAEHEDVAF